MSTRKTLKKFEQIYNETYNHTLRYVISKCENIDDVDDIIQDTYLDFYRMLKNGNEIADNEAYIITIAKNKLIYRSKSERKLDTISIFQEFDDNDFVIDIDSRYRYWIRLNNERKHWECMVICEIF